MNEKIGFSDLELVKAIQDKEMLENTNEKRNRHNCLSRFGKTRNEGIAPGHFRCQRTS
jgi:hypothetical protein